MLNDISNIPANSSVFVDSNIITYFLLKHRDLYGSSKSFLKRLEKGEIKGFLNSIVVSEVYFNYIRVKLSEVLETPPYRVIKEVKKNPKILNKVDLLPVDLFFKMPNLFLVHPHFTDLGTEILKNGLLPSDAIHLVTMTSNNILNIATNDRDFEKVKGIKVWRP
ncbi:MAG: PIN domain-containing protein [Euryarchaeota archaeon]|nr:PIN domain-containing protein [Euryarchaeota archaeon]